MAILYQGSRYFKGNEFIDPKGSKLVFEKNTKKGKIFVTDKGNKIGLTEGQVSRLKLVDKKVSSLNKLLESAKPITRAFLDEMLDYSVPVENLLFYYDSDDMMIAIPKSAIKSFKIFSEKERVIGYLYFQLRIDKIKIVNHYLDNSPEKSNIEVMILNTADGNDYYHRLNWVSEFQKVDENSYIMLFTGLKG